METIIKSPEQREPWSADGLRRHFQFIARISPIFRRRRTATFLRLFNPTKQTRILDVGGLPRFWQGTQINAHITISNLEPLDDYEMSFLTPNQTFALADATKLPWDDQSFDIVFSNSVIEHLGTAEKQQAFASECRRVGKSHWVQTPAREFPVEPHFLAPVIHWFPKPARRRLVPWVSVWGWLARPRADVLDRVMDELKLLTAKEFKTLFPENCFLTERLLGLPKSYVAYMLPAKQTAANLVQKLSSLSFFALQLCCE